VRHKHRFLGLLGSPFFPGFVKASGQFATPQGDNGIGAPE